jgi:hypothetical protein
MLLSRKYNKNVIKAALEKAKNKDRKEALKRVEKKKNERVFFALTYHPQLPSITKIIKTHWKTMVRDLEAKRNIQKTTNGSIQTTTKHTKIIMQSKTARKKT